MESMMSMMPGMSMGDAMTNTATATTGSLSTTATATASAMMASMTGVSGTTMSGMMNGCKISMLWNWYTVDTCFLLTAWRIRSGGGFAALCIGVILMTIVLQALGWLAKFYDQRLVQQAKQAAIHAGTSDSLIAKDGHHVSSPSSFRPNITQQAVRTLVRTAQFAMAYWIMLLAMYYNGYVIICIILGSFIGIYFFQWDRLGGLPGYAPETHPEPTGCCG
ncbi:hypothetical protein PFICI_13499 [Pestalotiopsis fici W106-1]|uniref:Copper transport protein n=1 Tax=Pestalotiopsis fici (strain W106-1 / CGMCC3.15140) TaxID=1229662 RepID=W3WM60_PESFW|nr:uncharacterized protein PFICI_13499 [Pestalotiopsis fici W106-1]ETS75015.1 hypothetical protein PFICI_13499 [Pestalotiopsis fici W106-1]